METDGERLSETEGAAADGPWLQPRRRSRSNSGSRRSRSNSGSRQQRNPNSFTNAQNEQERVDKRRLMDIGMSTHKGEDMRARMKIQGEKEKAKQKGKESGQRNRPVVKRLETSEDFYKRFSASLACSNCYVVTGHGCTGFQYKPELQHECKHTILMVARRAALLHVWVKVRPRPQMIDKNPSRVFSGQFKLCEQYHGGVPCRLGEARCTFCHSEEECELWQMDRDNPNFNLSTLISQHKQWAAGNDTRERPKVNSTDGKAPSGSAGPALQKNPLHVECPFQIDEVCGSCWEMLKLDAKKKGNNCSTTGMNHKWDIHRAFLLRPENELLRAFDPIRQAQCIQYRSFGSCIYGGSCKFIHGLAERKVYCWMASNQINSLEHIVSPCVGQKKAVTKRPIKAQESTSQDTTTTHTEDSTDTVSTSASTPMPTESWFCRVCNEDFVSRPAFDEHCSSARHEKNLLTDTDRPWHYRPPPQESDYPQLCSRLAKGTCPYDDVPDMYNQCKFAHNTLELEEWKERADCWKYKRSIINDPNGVFSYIYSLQDEFEKVKLESDMMKQQIDGVKMEFSPEATVYTTDKHFNHSWTFKISSERELQKVSLLINENRLHFHLGTDKKTTFCRSDQVEDGTAFLTRTGQKKHYTIKVNFYAGLNGSFRQKVIFDFGTRPLLAVALDVEVGSEFIRDEIMKLRKELPVERWTTKTHSVVPFSAVAAINPGEEALLCKYKPPDTTVFSQNSLRGGLNHNNYVHMMHRVVEMEELERTRIASKFNVVADIELTEAIPGKDIRAPIGHLFVRVPLTDQQLNEDTDVGSLMLSGSVTAWVGPSQPEASQSTPVVYEAEVVSEANFGFDGRGKDHFYICLSKKCCTSLRLSCGSVHKLAVQMQIDRLPFCRMHYGLDQLPDTSIVFPDLQRYNSSKLSKGLEVRSSFLNTTQLEIVHYMTMTDRSYTPPLVIYGPFGSGKTETLARATEVLMRTIPNSRILICALNDSAADLYIRNHFSKSKYLKTEEILRVYSAARRKDTISDDMHPYCQKNVKGQFRLPDEEALNHHRIIVTTLATSLMLTDQNMRGHFTHILLDEAGQCLECEAILPLTLATSSTCVVLAGDHLQLGPKSFSAAIPPTRLKLHISILQRLVLYYSYLDKANPGRLVKMLKVNYRSHPTIMLFLSKQFYGDAIECRSEWGIHCDFKPLVFYATSGEETSDTESTSYYNLSEIQEVVKQVSLLYENWPGSWGEKSPKKLAVLTPYSQQVNKVKTALTSSKACFKDITVSKVADVQGDEFHAVFLSIVRTHHGIVNSNNEETFGFYSDFRLVNTAMTRGRCQVAVIGDPSSLTSFGYCMPVWKSYLELCSNNDGLYHSVLPLETQGQARNLQDRIGVKNVVYEVSEEVYNVADMEADEILQQLKMKSEPAAMADGSNVQKDDHTKTTDEDPHFVYRLRESADSGTSQVMHQRKKVKWKQVPMVATMRRDNRVDDDEYNSSDEDDDGRSQIYQEYSEDEMLTFLREDPNTYKRCLITIKGAQSRVAQNLKYNDQIDNINIRSRHHCNRAFDGDEVLVKLVTTDDTKDSCPDGKVVGILRKAMNVKLCICRVDPLDPGVFIPLNKGIPLIRNLILDHHPKGRIAVYCKRKREGIQIKKYEALDYANPSSKLFLVRFLKWEANYALPLGIAVDVIPAPTGIEDGETVMKLEYNLREKYQMDTVSEMEELYNEEFQLSEVDIETRCNFVDDLTFTIDPQGSDDLDDAISVREIEKGWLIGIHIADVSHFVPQDSHIDQEAGQRCLTYYQPIGPPVAMLPPRLSEDLCSLKQDEKRMAMSVLLRVNDHDFKPVSPVEVSKSVICSNHQLTYKEAQQILDCQNMARFPKDLIDSLKLLDKVAKKWRHERLGDSSYAIKPDEVICLDAHRLIEELMIRANHEIAKILLHEVNNIVPVQIQHPPHEESLNEWCASYYQSAKQSLTLERAVSSFKPPKPCQCTETCSCNGETQSDTQIITYKFLSHLKDASERNDDKALHNLMATSILQPELAAAEFAYRGIQRKVEYKCSADVESPPGHASLNVMPYLHFTSPIRRYIDIVVHRLVKAVIEKTVPTYNQSDIKRICDQCNSASMKQKLYDKDIQALKWNVMMKAQAAVLYPIVESVQENRIFLRFPTVREIPLSVGSLPYSNLDLQTLPIYDEEKKEVELCWDAQVYNYSKYNSDSVLSTNCHTMEITLDPFRFVTQISAQRWQELINFIKEDDSSGLRQKVDELLESIRWKKAEVSHGDECEESIKLLLKVSPAQVHRVQLISSLRQRQLTPHIQLFTLAEDLDICIEHHQDPITCFAETTGLRVTKDYANTTAYRARWVPVLKAEAAYQAITNNDSFFLKDIDIIWKRTRNGVITGEITLLKEFCDEHQVFDFGEELYLCIRYNGIAVAEKFLGSDIMKIAQTEDKISFVAHCLVTRWEVDENKEKTSITMIVHQSSMPFPDLPLLANQRATIEATAEPLPIKRVLSAVKNLDKFKMARSLALGYRPEKLDAPTTARSQKEARSPKIQGYIDANEVQQHAVMKSLTNSFSLIHGPPGTGKTVTGVRIAIKFAKLNTDEGSDMKVLYCGPSNKSVEVVIGYLKKATWIKLVRVYSQDIVKLTYPVPTKYKPPRRLKSSAERKNLKQECQHPDIALHEMIRDDVLCPGEADEIRRYDEMFRAEIERLTTQAIRWTKKEKVEWREKVAEYRDLVKKASSHILAKADIVLVTSVGSGARIIKETIGSKINQVIIDEAGMCTEPEVLVPLTSCNTRQVVLIGDHQQLQPIVQSEIGQRLGLKKSLFERYVKDTDMLTIQYRMHEVIAKLPSDLFYDGRLVCGKPEQQLPSQLKDMWPGGTSCPIAFVDIRGEEKTQVITTSDGNEQSKYNPEEAEYTASVVKALVMDRKIPHSNIQVLSQYRAQCKEIREQFLECSPKVESKVTTVTRSQGSEVEYIVLSTVRSLPSEMIEMLPPKGWIGKHLGSIADPHQMNVAITRAKKGLIIIGNQKLLSASPLWKNLLEYYGRNKAVTKPGKFLQNIRGSQITTPNK